MGGTTFTAYAAGADVADAFRTATDEARYEYGNGGYSGTIAEKDSWVVIRHTPVSMSQADRLASRLIDADDVRISDKWGPAGAIPVYRVKEGEYTDRKVSKTLRLPGSVEPWQVRDRIEKDPCKVDEIVSDVSYGKVSGKWKVDARSTEGKAVTRYVWGSRSWATGRPTMAEARKAAIAEAEAAGHFDGSDFSVRAVTLRESGEPLVKVERTCVWTEVAVEITYRKMKPGIQRKTEGWLFFGWASS